jgi:predicted ATPase
LLVTLDPALVTTEGYSAAEVGQTHERARTFSRRLGDRHIFVTLSGAWVFHTVWGDLEGAGVQPRGLRSRSVRMQANPARRIS